MTKEQSAEIAKGIRVDTTKIKSHPDFILVNTVNNPRDGRWPLTFKEKLIIGWKRFKYNWLYLGKFKKKDYDVDQRKIMFMYTKF